MKPGRCNIERTLPDFENEKLLFLQGYKFIAGVDEVGRGALAGPVVAAAVILPPEINDSRLRQARDSKELSESKREQIFSIILKNAVSYGIGIVPSQIIDEINILKATRRAMIEAINNLNCSPDYLLIDGMILPGIKLSQKGIVKGDKTCLSIACASIIAKVTRDKIMVNYDKSYPGYGFARNKGYGTKYHLECLFNSGPVCIHRYSFSPIKTLSKLI